MPCRQGQGSLCRIWVQHWTFCLCLHRTLQWRLSLTECQSEVQLAYLISVSQMYNHTEGTRTSLHPSIKHYLKPDYILLCILISFLHFRTLIGFLKFIRAYNTNNSPKFQAKCPLKYFINSLSNILQPKILNKLPSLQMHTSLHISYLTLRNPLSSTVTNSCL